jgi:hypothetical protein
MDGRSHSLIHPNSLEEAEYAEITKESPRSKLSASGTGMKWSET